MCLLIHAGSKVETCSKRGQTFVKMADEIWKNLATNPVYQKWYSAMPLIFFKILMKDTP